MSLYSFKFGILKLTKFLCGSDVTDSKSEENHLTVPGVSASMSRQSLKSLLKSDNNRDTQRLSRYKINYSVYDIDYMYY